MIRANALALFIFSSSLTDLDQPWRAAKCPSCNRDYSEPTDNNRVKSNALCWASDKAVRAPLARKVARWTQEKCLESELSFTLKPR